MSKEHDVMLGVESCTGQKKLEERHTSENDFVKGIPPFPVENNLLRGYKKVIYSLEKAQSFYV